MAGTLVTGMATAAIGALTNKLSDMLSSEINMLRQVRRDIGFIENKLNSLKAGIQKMDAMVEADADLRSWARGLQELAYDTEDFIDEFKVHIARPRGHAITDFLCDTIQLITKWREHHEIYDRLQLIKDGIKDADKRGSKFLAQARETSTTEERHDPGQLEALIIEERELVGIDKPREHLIQWLLGGSKSLRVISVVAMGGMGVFVSSSLKSAKLLRVLDAEGQGIGRRFMPHGSQLQHLRYLNLRGTQNALLPEALSTLQNLEMLDLRDSSIGELPGGIVKLQRLRYLAVYSTGRTAEKLGAWGRHGARMPKGISRLKELLTLVLATAERGFIEELEEMKQLRRLGVTLLTMENDPHFWAAIQRLSYLRSLTVDAEKEDNLMSCMCSSYRLPSTLRSLKLYGLVMEKLPDNIKSLECLAKMVLSGTRLTGDPFPVLETLASLSEVQLYEDAYMGEVLHASGGFLMLRTMHLSQLSKFQLVTVKKEAMPVVENLRIERCEGEWKRTDLIELGMEGSRKSLIVDCDAQGLKE
uniref:Probable disease resistance protein RF9 n=1 Tax=Elaeis guineensis var. tenera TaxID=51953 RepID=A0A6I9SGG6_ELAGV|nr:probable disease resistance protein RF9 [Elaeis guineensis]